MFRLCLLPALVAISVSMTACQPFGARENPVVAPEGAHQVLLLDPNEFVDLDHVQAGWYHKTFFSASPAIYSRDKQEPDAVRCTTDDSASMLLRHTDLPLTPGTKLVWEWRVDRAIASKVDELTEEGDDAAARFFVVVEDDAGHKSMFEIIWSAQLARGQEKVIGGFYHFVARGKADPLGTWVEDSLDLTELLTKRFGAINNPRLWLIGLFCDTDATAAKSDAAFRKVSLVIP